MEPNDLLKNDNTGFTPDFNINTANLSGAAAMKLQPPVPATEAAGLSASIEEQAKQYANSIVPTEEVTQQKNAFQKSLGKIKDFISGTKGEDALTSDLYAAEVDPAKKELNDINNQLLSEQVGLRRRLEALDKNSQGLFGGALEQEKARIQKESIAKQADLSVIQLARQNNYFGAKEIADRKINALLEADANKLKALEFTYQENKELFNKTEQRQFESQQEERKRLLEDRRTELKAVNDLAINALQNGAPTSIVQEMQKATTQADAVRIGGQYVDALDRAVKLSSLETDRVQRANIYDQIAERNRTNPANFVTPPLINPVTGQPDPKSQFTSIINSTGAKTDDKLKLTGAVISAAQDFATNNSSGNFSGFGPIRAGALTVSPEGQNNRTYLSALEGTIESWMTGASVSKGQEERIRKDLIPRDWNTDKQIRQKINALTNYMLSYSSGYLGAQGVKFEPQKVDFFDPKNKLTPNDEADMDLILSK